jgi:hypothetical protein
MEIRTFETIVLHDPAIDWEAVGRARQMAAPEAEFATSRDMRLLSEDGVSEHGPYLTHPGMSPTIYRYRRITRPQLQKFVSLAGSTEDRFIRAFQAGVVEITCPDRPVYAPKWISKGALVMDEKELTALERELGIEWAALLDIGSQILTRSTVPFDCAPRFPVPPSSVDAWAAVSARTAARNQTAPHPTSDAPREP